MANIGKVTRRQLIRDFGMLGVLASPILRSIASGAVAPAPIRHISVFKPLGFTPGTFWPKTGFNFTGQVIEPLTPHAADLRFVKNVTLKHRNGDAHALGFLTLFTGTDQRGMSGTEGFDYPDGPSLDQAIVQNMAPHSFPSLHFGIGFDSNQASVLNRIAHKGGKVSIPSESDAGKQYGIIMDQIGLICGGGGDPATKAAKLAEIRNGKSVLDYQVHSIQSFKTKYGLVGEQADKLEATMTKIREVETKLAADKKLIEDGGSGRPCPTVADPHQNFKTVSVPDNAFKVMIDLMILAFDWDLTRVATLQLGTHSSYQVFPATSVTTPYHPMSHLLKVGDIDKLFTVDKYVMSKFAMLLAGLKGITDPDGKNALYNSTVLMGSELSIGDDHSRENMPFVIAGQGGGRLKAGGQMINLTSEKNHHDLLYTLANVHQLPVTKFGDAKDNTGIISQLV